MKKTFVILITVALLGILAASVAPGPTRVTAVRTTSGTASAATVTSTPSTTLSSEKKTLVTTPPSTGQYADGTYTGLTSSNQFDEIQVAVTINGGKVVSISTPTLRGNSGQSTQINSYAVPPLTKQAIAAQTSQIDGISGASYTTAAYTDSLQSALDQAKA